jgi:hypothetical protein
MSVLLLLFWWRVKLVKARRLTAPEILLRLHAIQVELFPYILLREGGIFGREILN